MKVGTIVTGTDTNPLYMDFIPLFVKAWGHFLPEADIRIVLVADSIPEKLCEYSKYIVLFPPIPEMHSAFQAQCIRLLYPREITRNEGVLITDMDMIPMNRTYYIDSIRNFPDDAFIVYRDNCLPREISICYNIAHPNVWASMFGSESSDILLKKWYIPSGYDGVHGGKGWNTDQKILVNSFGDWNGNKIILNDLITKFARLDRAMPMNIWETKRSHIGDLIRSGYFVDYHCIRPYAEYRELNDWVVSQIDKLHHSNEQMVNVFSFCLYGPDNPKYYRGLLENIALAGMFFPTWKVYVYYSPDVTEAMITQLRACTSVVLFATHVNGPANMIHRFYAIDEPNVHTMMVRDADSRIHWKDRWAIREFIQSHCIAHTIRDHIQHTAPIMGGLWGLKKHSGISIRSLYSNYAEDITLGHRNAHDQNFLADVIYPRVINSLLVHHSNLPPRIGEIHACEFPFEWSADLFCGRIENDYLDRPEPPRKQVTMFPSPIVRIRNSIPITPNEMVQDPRFSVREPSTNANIINFLHRK